MKYTYFPSLLLCLILLFIGNLLWGSVEIPSEAVVDFFMGKPIDNRAWETILLQSRLPQAITALLTGAALSIAGLLLQSIFNNPLAGPSILGIDAGASLGVAVAMLLWGSQFSGLPLWLQEISNLPIVLCAFAGAFLVLAIIMLFSTFIKSNLTLLIIGIMVGYFTSASISILNYFADEQGVHSFTLWGMGDFSSVSLQQIPSFAAAIIIPIFLSFLCIKPLNAMLLGDRYAESLGVNIKTTRVLLLMITGLLTATTTAFCGPISFLGLVVPHIARLSLRSSNQRLLLPATCLLGAIIALTCNLLSNWPGGNGLIPLNAITPIIGAPIILYVIIFQKKIEYFN